MEPDNLTETMDPIFNTIIDYIPAPVDNQEEPLQFQVTLLDYSEYLGRIGIGRVFRGKISVGQHVTLIKADGSSKSFRITKLFGFIGLKRIEIKEPKAGDIVAVTGMEDINVGETVCPEDQIGRAHVLTPVKWP